MVIIDKQTIAEFNTRQYGSSEGLPESGRVRVEKILNFAGTGKQILDVGCGDGSIASLLTSQGNRVVGLDVSSAAIRVAKRRGIQTYSLNLEEKWPERFRHQFDLVFAGEIIEHIYNTDSFLENIRKVLKKNGQLLLSTPNVASLGRRLSLLAGKNPLLETSLGEKDAGHIRYFTFYSLVNLLNRHSFVILRQTSTVVNFDFNGLISSKYVADLFPKFGSTIIVLAGKAK
jgi:2-polyprenyl-3-methyl-5-hydroxy-6-metoxy-1,4-benzoquinol methylase